jgi:hypothetical protein
MNLNRRKFLAGAVMGAALAVSGCGHPPAPTPTFSTETASTLNEPPDPTVGIHYRGTYDGWPRPGVPPSGWTAGSNHNEAKAVSPFGRSNWRSRWGC